jgi:copper(I)-binding protein
MLKKLTLFIVIILLGFGHMAAADITNIKVTDIWARATPPSAKTAAIYLTLTNTGTAEDRLVAVSTDVSEKAQIHTMSMEDSVMRMRWLQDGLILPVGQETKLSPSSTHIMLIGLKHQLVVGQKIFLTLDFGKTGSTKVEAEVKPMGYPGKDQ